MTNNILVVYHRNGLTYTVFKTASIFTEWNRPHKLIFVGIYIYLVHAGHATKSGVTHFVAATEEEALAEVRRLVSFIPQNNMEEAPLMNCTDDPMRVEESLNEIVPDLSILSARCPYGHCALPDNIRIHC